MRVPKKNISRLMADVKNPRQTAPPSPPPPPPVSAFSPQPRPAFEGTRPPLRKMISALVLLAVLAYAAVVFVRPYAERWLNVPTAPAGDFAGSARDLGQEWLPFLQGLSKFSGGAGEAYSSLRDFLGSLTNLQENGLQLAMSGRGGELIASLDTMRVSGEKLYEASGGLISGAAENLLPSAGDFLSLRSDLLRLNQFLDKLTPWLKEDADRHLVIFLENPSELRPGGGFLGSYAEVVLRGGNIQNLSVHDISEADAELALKTIPPQPLWLVVRNWRAADANWFFDFPTSAEKTIGFLEASDKYAQDKIKFDGAIGVSDRVISELLKLTGPLSLSSGEKVDADNFLSVIQEEVQSGQAAGASAPKKILSELAPLLLDKLQSLSAPQSDQSLSLLTNLADKRDLRFYFRNPDFQKFFDAYGLTGRIFAEPQNWNGSYLAVVDANVGANKSDYYMRQSVDWQIRLTTDGNLEHQVTVSRNLLAPKDAPSWYRATNENYLQVLTSPSAQLTYAQGGRAKKPVTRVNYSKEGYQQDKDVAVLEASRQDLLDYPFVQKFEDFGKNIFATWVSTPRGATSTVELNYLEHLPSLPAEGETYEFVLEKQSGSKGNYTVDITAPVGFRFKESGSAAYEYNSSDPPGRLTLALTLEKIQ